MRLKSKSVTLVALLVMTAMPRALDQLSDLGNLAQERFRTELLNIFWSLTAPETHPARTKQYSELLARAASPAPRCNGSSENRTARPARTFSRSTAATQPAAALEYLQSWGTDETPTDGRVAEALAAPVWREETSVAGEHATAAHQKSALPDKQETVVLVAENQKEHALFDEAALPVQVEDAIAQLEFNRDETAATPRARAVPKRESSRERFGQNFAPANFQIRLPENLGPLLNDKFINNSFINSSTLIKVRDTLSPAKPKCRVRVLRLAPETPRPPEDKPAIIS
jgi:hypothetical protein